MQLAQYSELLRIWGMPNHACPSRVGLFGGCSHTRRIMHFRIVSSKSSIVVQSQVRDVDSGCSTCAIQLVKNSYSLLFFRTPEKLYEKPESHCCRVDQNCS